MTRPLIAILLLTVLAACAGGEPTMSFAPTTGKLGTAPQVQSITTLLPVQP
ncbi:hypothetical protein [Pontivivens ytuae]|uniref:Uncharacterized protein n=1 Tax=Pontivivens ytuae TaxID=2789856 RepID=A0A7S9QCH8_9RHOB|nr:hypothetical protein [Pontivivens ytuae]QPH53933.1 hypothetical protein I0K15_19520 [Pontivivens ytuae]